MRRRRRPRGRARRRTAQADWAALPHPARAAVLRRAGAALGAARRRDRRTGTSREVGAIPPLAGLRPARRRRRSATRPPRLPVRAARRVLSSEEPRLSLAPSRSRSASSGVISPFNVPLILGIRSVAPALALGNAVLLKPDPRTAVTRRRRRSSRIFEEAGLPAGLLQLLPGGADVGEAHRDATRRSRVVSFTGSTARRPRRRRARRPAPQARPPGARRQLRADRAGRRRRRQGGVSLAAWGSFLHQGQICMTTGRHLVHESLYDEYVDQLAAKADSPAGRRPGRRPGRTSARSSTRPARPGPRAGARRASTPVRALRRGRHLRGALLPADRARRTSPLDSPAFCEEVFGPVASGRAVRHRRRGRRARADTEYGLSLGIVTRDVLRGARDGRRASRPASCTSTTRR